MMNWDLGNKELLALIEELRTTECPDTAFDLCDKAAEIIAGLMAYEADHGLRTPIEYPDD